MKLSSRRARLVAAAALALVIGVPASLGATGLAAKVVGMSDSTPTAAEYPSSKVTICHHTHSKTNPFVTITVSQNALPAHMAHGDTVGACAPTAAPVAAATSHKLKKAHKAKHSAGKSSLHGKSAAAKAAVHGKSGETHGQSSAPTTGSATVHGKSHSTTHGQGAAHQKTHGKGQANGKSQETHGKSGQLHGSGHGQGQGNGQGQGQSGTHGNGGGNGKGH